MHVELWNGARKHEGVGASVDMQAKVTTCAAKMVKDMKYLYATISGLLMGAAAVAAPSPNMPPHASTAMPPSMTTRCPPGSNNENPPNSRAPYASTSTHAMPRNPDARIPPEEPLHPQPPELNPPPCR